MVGLCLVGFAFIHVFFADRALAISGNPKAVRFNGNDIWRGTPEVKFGNEWYTICADDQYWDWDIANAICHHRGFQSTMLKRQSPNYKPIQASYVTCEVDYEETPPLHCESINSCAEAPWMSCLFPGNRGCFEFNAADPQSDLVTVSQLTLEACSEKCRNLGYAHFAVAFGQACYCNHSVEALLDSDTGDCQSLCPGNNDEACGGDESVSVYDSNIGVCDDDDREISPYQPVLISSVNFPMKYPSGSQCTWEVEGDALSGDYYDLEITTSYQLDSGDMLRIFSDNWTFNITASSGSGRRSAYIPSYPIADDTVYVEFTSLFGSDGGSFVVSIYLIYVYPSSESYSSYEYETTPSPYIISTSDETEVTPTPTLPLIPTTQDPGANPLIGIIVGAVVGGGIVILFPLVAIIICIIIGRNRGAKERELKYRNQQVNQQITAISNAAYTRDNELVTASAGIGSSRRNDVDDTHKYTTIEGEYYYAPNLGEQPPLPNPRTRDSGGPTDAQYEELPESPGTPYQSLTKSDRQRYQDLLRNGDEKTPVAPNSSVKTASDNEYLKPM